MKNMVLFLSMVVVLSASGSIAADETPAEFSTIVFAVG